MASAVRTSDLEKERLTIATTFASHKFKAFSVLHKRLRLDAKLPALAPAVQCLEVLGESHNAVTDGILMALVSSVEALVERMAPAALLSMAEATLELLSLPKLRSIPLKAIFLLASAAGPKGAPEALVQAVLARAPESVVSLPMGFRRQAWALSPQLLSRHLEEPLDAYAAAPEVRFLSPGRVFRPRARISSGFRRCLAASEAVNAVLDKADTSGAVRDATGRVIDARRAFRTLAETVDRSEELALHTARALRARFLAAAGDGAWSTLLLDLVLQLEKAKVRPLELAPLFDLARAIAAVSDQQNLGDKGLRRLRSALVDLVGHDGLQDRIYDLRDRAAAATQTLSNPFLQTFHAPTPRAPGASSAPGKPASSASRPKGPGSGGKKTAPRRTKAEQKQHRITQANALLRDGPDATAAMCKEIFLAAWEVVKEKDSKLIFADPVTEAIAPDYSSIIAKPMDLSTIRRKAKLYKSVTEFSKDVNLMLSNCKKYNGQGNVYYRDAARIEKWYEAKGEDLVVDEVLSRLQDEPNTDESASEAEEDKPKPRKKPPTTFGRKRPLKVPNAGVPQRSSSPVPEDNAARAAASQLEAKLLLQTMLSRSSQGASPAAAGAGGPVEATPLPTKANLLCAPQNGDPDAAARNNCFGFLFVLLAEPGLTKALRAFVLRVANKAVADGRLPAQARALKVATQILSMGEMAAGGLLVHRLCVPDPPLVLLAEHLPTLLAVRMALELATKKRQMAAERRSLREARGMALEEDDAALLVVETEVAKARKALGAVARRMILGDAEGSAPGLRLHRGLLFSFLEKEAGGEALEVEVVLEMVEGCSAALRLASTGLAGSWVSDGTWDPEKPPGYTEAVATGTAETKGAGTPAPLALLRTDGGKLEVRAGGRDASHRGLGGEPKRRKLSIKSRGAAVREEASGTKVTLKRRKGTGASPPAPGSLTKVMLKRRKVGGAPGGTSPASQGNGATKSEIPRRKRVNVETATPSSTGESEEVVGSELTSPPQATASGIRKRRKLKLKTSTRPSTEKNEAAPAMRAPVRRRISALLDGDSDDEDGEEFSPPSRSAPDQASDGRKRPKSSDSDEVFAASDSDGEASSAPSAPRRRRLQRRRRRTPSDTEEAASDANRAAPETAADGGSDVRTRAAAEAPAVEPVASASAARAPPVATENARAKRQGLTPAAPRGGPVLAPPDPYLGAKEAQLWWDAINEAFVSLLRRDSKADHTETRTILSKASGTPLFEKCLQSRFQVLRTAVASGVEDGASWQQALACQEHVMYVDFVVAALQARAARKSVHLEEKLLGHLSELRTLGAGAGPMNEVWDKPDFIEVREAYEKLFQIAPSWRETLVG